MSATSTLSSVSRFFGAFRWLFMPLGLFALVAVGIHAAADVMDDRLLRWVEALDASFDALLAKSEATAAWVNRVDSRERTLIARALALTWELVADFLLAVPMLAASEPESGERLRLTALLTRLNQQPTPMRVLRPLITTAFVLAGAYSMSRLVESTAFVGLVGDVASADTAAVVARIMGGTAMTIVVFSHGWRAVLRSLEHADAVCAKSRHPYWSGVWGSAIGLPLALALAVESEVLLSFFR